MENFNLYYSQIKKLFEEKGMLLTFKRKEHFVKQNTPSLCAGWIESGFYCDTDEQRNENTVLFRCIFKNNNFVL